MRVCEASAGASDDPLPEVYPADGRTAEGAPAGVEVPLLLPNDPYTRPGPRSLHFSWPGPRRDGADH